MHGAYIKIKEASLGAKLVPNIPHVEHNRKIRRSIICERLQQQLERELLGVGRQLNEFRRRTKKLTNVVSNAIDITRWMYGS